MSVNISMNDSIEFWFIPMDILMLITTSISTILALIYLIVIIVDRTCHTISMMLVANSCLSELIFSSDMFGMALFTLQNDFQRIHFEDSLCRFRGFLGYIATVLQNYSYLLQSIYRYILVVYPTRIFYQSTKFQLILVCSTWIWAIICPLPYLLTNAIKYDLVNEICQMPMGLTFLNIYNAFCVYCIPILLIMLIYLKLVRYVQQTSQNITSTNNFIRVQRELKMVRRIIILIIGLTAIGFPYAIFVFMALFTNPPKYHFRIAYIFVDTSLVFVMIAILQFNEPLKTSIIKKLKRQTNGIVPTFT